jgi:hypothetical protein
VFGDLIFTHVRAEEVLICKSSAKQGGLHKTQEINQMLIYFRQAPLYPNMQSKIGNKSPISTQVLGLTTNLKTRRRVAPVRYVELQTKKKSSSSAIPVMLHTIPTVSSSTEFQKDIGFAWNARAREHMPELKNLWQAKYNYSDGEIPEHKPVFVAVANA